MQKNSIVTKFCHLATGVLPIMSYHAVHYWSLCCREGIRIMNIIRLQTLCIDLSMFQKIL